VFAIFQTGALSRGGRTGPWCGTEGYFRLVHCLVVGLARGVGLKARGSSTDVCSCCSSVEGLTSVTLQLRVPQFQV
jgi:hypothetical protein